MIITDDAIPDTTAAAGLRAALRILDHWGANAAQSEAILGICSSLYSRLRQEYLATITLEPDQLTRISLLLNIHAALRTLFDTPQRSYRFMRLKNHNVPFNGSSPLELISGGDIADLHRTFSHIDALCCSLQ